MDVLVTKAKDPGMPGEEGGTERSGRMTLMGDIRNRGLVLCYECTLGSGATALGRLRRTEPHTVRLYLRGK